MPTKLGSHLSEEVREKMSKAHKGHMTSSEARKNMSKAQLGHTVSDETKEKISKSLKGKLPWHTGYKVGRNIRKKSGSNFYREIIFSLLGHDGKTCSRCNRIVPDSSQLCIHHIDNNPINSSRENLIVICRYCHSQIHWAEWKIEINRQRNEQRRLLNAFEKC
jgi:hypothetical protein